MAKVIMVDVYKRQGKYPVIFLTLKGVEGLTFADAKRMLGTILANEMDRHYYLKTSDGYLRLGSGSAVFHPGFLAGAYLEKQLVFYRDD